ncbi:MAG: tryptophan 2,3-dioxygenase [Acidobacteriota bacterium]
MTRHASSYNEYLRVPELLKLQQRLSDHHDEMLFIIIHQVYELWFREMLHEAEAIIAAVSSGRVRLATRLYRRLIEIQRVLLQQIPVLETMTPSDFNKFRDLLNPASGFQSSQFRELEFVSGMKDPSCIGAVSRDATTVTVLERRLAEPSLYDVFDDLLRARGFEMPVGKSPQMTAARLDALKKIYGEQEDHDDLYQLCEAMIEYDENFLLWRYHHVRMVERMIGRKRGTGGSEGVSYLTTTLAKRCFPELWEVRTHLTSDPPGG